MRFEIFLVPIDFSSHSYEALEHAIHLASLCHGRIHLLHAYQMPKCITPRDLAAIDPDFSTIVPKGTAQRLEAASHKVAAAGLEAETHLTALPAAEATTEIAKEIRADLIVIGTRGLTGLKHALLGSVADGVVRAAPCPVMTVRNSFN
jgi:nucleotide-binding universal stress UspA family protein